MDEIPIKMRLRNWTQQGLNKVLNEAGVASINELFSYIANKIEEQCLTVPMTSNGKHWLLGDVCLTDDGRKGTVAGFDGIGGINVLFENEGNGVFEWFPVKELSRDYVQQVIDELEMAREDESCISPSELEYWTELLKLSKED